MQLICQFSHYGQIAYFTSPAVVFCSGQQERCQAGVTFDAAAGAANMLVSARSG
jgi:hypothetical protein